MTTDQSHAEPTADNRKGIREERRQNEGGRSNSPTAKSKSDAGTDASTRPVVVGVDGSALSADALRFGARIASALNVPLEAIAVWQAAPIDLDYTPSQIDPELEAKQALNEVSHKVFGTGTPSRFTKTTHPGDPAEVLVEKSSTAEMLVVGSDGHAGLWSRISGKVSTSCAIRAHCPVTVIHHVQA